MPDELDPIVDFVAGTVSGGAAILVAQPFDTVKVRLQNPVISPKYCSTLNAFTTIIREERFKGLYKGVVSPLATCAFMNGLVFTSYKFLTKVQLEDPAALPSLPQIGLAGAGCGIMTSFLASPAELVKIKQQNTLGNNASNPSAGKVALDLLKQGGIRGFYRGLSATALRDTGYGTYFMTYEATCRHFRPASNIVSETYSTPWPVLFLAGGLAGIAGWVVTFPMDVIKTRMQSIDVIKAGPGIFQYHVMDPRNPYRSILSTIIHSYRSEGYRVFFKGLVPILSRAVPVNITTFSVYEFVARILS